MKRMKRIVALALAVALCLSLSGCRWLENAKTSQGKWQGDGTFVLNGYVYKPLIYEFTYELNTSGDFETGYITTADVPVLLSLFLGEEYYSYHDGIIIETFGQDPNVKQASLDEYYVFYYCREDYYDSVVARAQNGFEVEDYAYSYWGEDFYYNYAMEEYVLSAEERAAVDDVLRYVQPKLEDEDMKLYYDNSLWIDLDGYSRDRLFWRSICKLAVCEGTYYLSYEDADYNSCYCEVPLEKYPIFDKIIKAYVDSMTEEELADLGLSIST